MADNGELGWNLKESSEYVWGQGSTIVDINDKRKSRVWG